MLTFSKIKSNTLLYRNSTQPFDKYKAPQKLDFPV